MNAPLLALLLAAAHAAQYQALLDAPSTAELAIATGDTLSLLVRADLGRSTR